MDVLAAIEGSAFSTMVRESGSIWAYPTVLTLHTYGLALLVGAHWAMSLRVLGVGARVPLGAMAHLFRWVWAGFTINLITGLILLGTAATTKAVQPVFWIKMAFVFLGLFVALRMKARLFPRGADRATLTVPPGARPLAVMAIVFWIGAIAAGRLMAYL